MSGGPKIDLGQGTLAMFRLSWLRLIRGRKFRLGVVATVLVVVSAAIARYAANESTPAEAVESGVRLGFFGLLVYLLPFLFTSGAIAEEVEARTFPFLALRPAGRIAIVVGKYLASATMSILLLALGVLVLHVSSFATEPTSMIDELPGTLRAMSSISLLALTYCAICLFWGALVVEAGGFLSVLYLVVMEFGLSWMPSFLRLGSMNYLASQLAGLPKRGFYPEWVPDVELWVCGLVIALVTGVFLSLAALVVRTSELGFGKA